MTTSFLEFERAGWRDPALCENYDARLSTVTAQCIDALLDAAGVKAGALVLDVATGAGYVAAAAAKRGAEACGVDFSATQVALARSRYPGLRFEEASADALAFSADRFDASAPCSFPGSGCGDAQARLKRWPLVQRDVPRELSPGGTPRPPTGRWTWACPWDRTSSCSATPERCKAGLRAGFVQPRSSAARAWRVPSPGRWSRPSCRRAPSATLRADVRSQTTSRPSKTPSRLIVAARLRGSDAGGGGCRDEP
jgi:SAM-dependent methyltransferase